MWLLSLIVAHDCVVGASVCRQRSRVASAAPSARPCKVFGADAVIDPGEPGSRFRAPEPLTELDLRYACGTLLATNTFNIAPFWSTAAALTRRFTAAIGVHNTVRREASRYSLARRCAGGLPQHLDQLLKRG